MLFVALWLWLDQPCLWALAEALALTYGLWVCGLAAAGGEEEASPGRRANRQSSLRPPPWGERAEA